VADRTKDGVAATLPCGAQAERPDPAILAKVTSRPDATIAELRTWLLETHKVSASTGLINKTLATLDLTFIKKSLHAAEASA
jgi:hypothetical protein